MGDYAVFSNSTGFRNTGIGSAAILSANNSDNTAVGASALRNTNTGEQTAVGSQETILVVQKILLLDFKL